MDQETGRNAGETARDQPKKPQKQPKSATHSTAMALWKIVCSLAFTISMSATMIIFNAVLLQGFRHPVWLTCWHQLSSTLCILLVRLLLPKMVTIGSSEQVVGFKEAVRLGAPIAATQCLGLIAGNTAVMRLGHHITYSIIYDLSYIYIYCAGGSF